MDTSRSTTGFNRRRFLAVSAAATGWRRSRYSLQADEPLRIVPPSTRDAEFEYADQYRVNWARASQGASVVESAKIHSATDVGNLVGARLGKGEGKQNGTTIFADRVRQRERFVIDLGRERLIGRLFVGSHAPDGRRHPDSVAIRGSTESPEGPWQSLVTDGDMARRHTFVFDNTPVRFLEMDFGECTDGWGTRVSSFGAFTRYRCPESQEVARRLATLFDREAEELKPFFRAADANRWDEAVSALRDVYAKRVEERPSEASPRSIGIAEDMLAHRFQFGQPAHQFPPGVHDIDWAFELDYEWTNSLNRCGFWTHAVNVFLATGDARIAGEIEAQLLHWIESCPPEPKPADGRFRSWQTWDKPAKVTWRSLDSAIRLWKLGQLSVTLYAYGRPLLIDPGRLNYRAEGRVFRSTPYHNTVTVDGGDQREGHATFERWLSTDTYDLAVGSHQLYPGVTHRRTVLFVKPHFWVVRDDLLSGGDHRYRQRWHLPENAAPKRLDGHMTVTQFAEGGNLLLAPVTKIAESSVEDYEIAYEWDERVPAKLCSYVPDGVPMVTLLVPYRGTAVPSVAVLSSRTTADGTDLRIDVGNRPWRLVVDDVRCAVEGG